MMDALASLSGSRLPETSVLHGRTRRRIISVDVVGPTAGIDSAEPGAWSDSKLVKIDLSSPPPARARTLRCAAKSLSY
jgi:hypothetical protein